MTESGRRGLTRRDVARLAAGAVGAAALLGRSRASDDSEVPPLERRVPAATVNAHCHLPDANWLERPPPRPPADQITLETVAAYAKSRGIELPADKLPDAVERSIRYYGAATLAQQAELFVAEMDAAGIDVAVLQMIDHSFQPGDFGRRYKVPYEQVLEETAEVVAEYPGRFLMFAGVDPSRGKDGVKLFERAVTEYGCVGLGEWVTQQWEVFPNDRNLCYPYFEKCLELGVPYSNNCEGRFEHCAPGVFGQIAEDFPELRIALGGSGRPRPTETRNGTARWGFPQEAFLLAARYPNVYLDLDDWQRLDADGIAYFLTYLRRALTSEARRRVMFGSDYPVTYVMYSERGWIDVTLASEERGIAFSAEELKLFFSSNALDYLGPAAAKKLATSRS